MNAGISLETVSVSVLVVMALQGPGLHQLEDPGRASGHQCHHLLQAGPLDLAGLAGAALGVGRPLEAGDHFEVRLVLAGSVALGVAGTGLGAVAEGASGIGNGGFRRMSCNA